MDHQDVLERELLIATYLRRRIEPSAANEFESHYLECDECFEEVRVSELLLIALSLPAVQRREIDGVVVLEFASPADLTAGSRAAEELSRSVLGQSDTKVLIDLRRVSRVDSAGLGLLLSCYSHVQRRQGDLKLLGTPASLDRLLGITKINSILASFESEQEAIQSFSE